MKTEERVRAVAPRKKRDSCRLERWFVRYWRRVWGGCCCSTGAEGGDWEVEEVKEGY